MMRIISNGIEEFEFYLLDREIKREGRKKI